MNNFKDHFQVYTELENIIKRKISQKSSELTNNLNYFTKDEKSKVKLKDFSSCFY